MRKSVNKDLVLALRNFIVLTFVVICFSTCKKKDDSPSVVQNGKNIAPNGFNYSTTKNISLNIQLLSNIGEPLVGVPVTFHSVSDTTELLKSITDKQGRITTKIELPSYFDQLLVKPHSVGLIKDIAVRFNDNSLNLIIGGIDGLKGDFVKTTTSSIANNNRKSFSSGLPVNFSSSFSYMGAYDLTGRPLYLHPIKGQVSSNLLGFLNYSLPEEKDIVSHHLVYLSPAANRDLDVIETSEIFITYVSEGAANQNSLGYYTYTTGHKPTSINDIPEIKYIFPNTSGLGSGGGLVSGDRVSLGVIDAGTSIGLVLFANGWDDNAKSVTKKYDSFFSNEILNPEVDVNKKQHSVLLDFEQENLIVLGFEDINRESGKSDDDFNDVILYLSSVNKNAISRKNIIKLSAPIDSDGDGISDDNDAYPGDSKKVYNTFYPSENGWGTLAFEDNWPKQGDYDLNDLVVSYRYSYAVNATNKIVEMKADFKINESLAYFKNGFGVEMPIHQNVIDDVRGYINSGKYIEYNPNGTEAGHTNAVIIPFDNQQLIYDGKVNYSEPVRVIIEFLTPQTISLLNLAPYNPFLISNGKRAYEIHLPNHLPTNKADQNLFGSFQDLTNPSQGKYYIGENNWPWAIHFAEPFNFPAEGQAVDEKFTQFKDWANSGGTLFPDWYK